MNKNDPSQSQKSSKAPNNPSDTKRNGDAKNGVGEDNHSGKEEKAEDFIRPGKSGSSEKERTHK